MTYKVGDKVVFIGDHTFGPADWRQWAVWGFRRGDVYTVSSINSDWSVSVKENYGMVINKIHLRHFEEPSYDLPADEYDQIMAAQAIYEEISK